MKKLSIFDFLSLSFCLIIAYLGVTSLFVSAQSSAPTGRAIVGIDYGTTNVRMGMLRSGVGSVEIVLSFESDRKTINAVAYRDESIFFSQTAMNMFPKFPKAIFCRMNKLLGKLFNSPSVQEYRETFIHEIAEDPDRKTVLITEPVNGHLVPIEQIAATFFVHLMDQAQQHAGFKVSDCVISVPAYFDQFERQAVLDAAKIAGFNVLSLINNVSAAALFKTTTANDLTVPTNFIIYDSGSGGTSAALVKIDPKKTIDGVTAKSMEILGLESEAGLGGDLIDDRIASFLISKFEHINPGVKVVSGKPRNKVLIEASRLKKILNANDSAIASLEDLVEEYGMSIPVKRSDIDDLLTDLAPRFTAPITNLLEKSKLTIDDISAVLLIGGNSRHQFLLKSLRGAFGPDKISFTLDPDESIVKGATLYGAKLHPAFRLRPTHFTDISPSGIYLQYREVSADQTEGESKLVQLFPDLSPLQTRKSLSLKKINNVIVDLFYSRNDQKIASIHVNGFDEALEKASSKSSTILASKMKIPVLLSSSGHLIVEDPVAVVDLEEIISKNVYKTHTKSATQTATSSSTEATAVNSDGSTPTIETTPTATEAEPQEEKSVETQVIEEKVKKTKSYNLPFEVNFSIPAMKSDSIAQSQKHIEDARAKEFETTLIATARNDLEKAVYRIQGSLNSGDFLIYSSNSERSNMKSHLNKVSKVLADEKNGADVYLNHLKDITKLEADVKRRQVEDQERPAAIEAISEVLNSVNEFIKTQKLVDPEQRAPTDDELDVLFVKSQEISKWLQEKTKKQASSAKSLDPVLSVADIEAKKSELLKALEDLKSKKMPEKPKEQIKQEEEVKQDGEVKDEAKETEGNAAADNKENQDEANQKESSKEASNDNPEEHFEL